MLIKITLIKFFGRNKTDILSPFEILEIFKEQPDIFEMNLLQSSQNRCNNGFKSKKCATEKSGLLMDVILCHKRKRFFSSILFIVRFAKYIPGGYTSTLQPFNVSVIRFFESGTVSKYMSWKSTKYLLLNSNVKILFPTRKDVAKWPINFV